MTDRVKGLTVVFDQDFRDDDVEVLVSAIKQMRGVGSVENVLVTSDDYFARSKIKRELIQEMMKLLYIPKE